jgi:tetratricopeptide (TPR) repeat protein
MTQRSDRPIVGRDPLVSELRAAFDATDAGPKSVLLGGGPGLGRRTLSDRFLTSLTDASVPHAVLRLRAEPADDGVRTLLRLYGSFVSALARSDAFGDEDAADILAAAAESTDDERVKEWTSGVATSIRSLRSHGGPGQYQIQLPRENPYLALLYTLDVLGPRARWVVDLHDLGSVVSPSFWSFLAALVGRARSRNWKILFVVAPGPNRYSEQPSEARPGPLTFTHALFSDAALIDVAPLDLTAVSELIEDTYRPHRFPEELPARLLASSGGEPDLLHEILDVLEEDDSITWDDKGYSLTDLDDVDLDVLVPMPREDDDEDDEEVDDSLLELVLHTASHAGRVFPGTLLRSHLDADEDAIDDAIDAMPHIFEELRFDESLGSWLYRFRYEFQRRYFQGHPPEAVKQRPADIARALGTVMMQSYAPASFDYVWRAAELFAEAGEGQGGRTLLAMAMGSDRGELHRFALELLERFPDSPWPTGLERFLHTARAERAVNGAPPEAAEQEIAAAAAWAKKAGDAETEAFCDLLRCRMGVRVGDFPAAEAAGQQALAGFRKVDNATRAAETLNQLAMVALNKGDGDAAERYVKQAGKTSTIPPIKAHSQYIVGLLEKAKGRLPQALDAGNLALSLESMLNEGECALMTGRISEKAPMLERALEMSRAMRSPQRERVAARLLCQGEAARGNGEAAYEIALHALQLSRELGLEAQSDVDLYHCGLFAVLAGKREEGVDYLNEARKAAEAAGRDGLLPEILFNLGQVKLVDRDFEGARQLMEQALAKTRERGDKQRELRVLQHLAMSLGATGDLAGAVGRIKEALELVPPGSQWKQLRKDLRDQLSQAQKATAALPEGDGAGPESAGA